MLFRYGAIVTLMHRSDSYLNAQRDLIYDAVDNFIWFKGHFVNWAKPSDHLPSDSCIIKGTSQTITN